MNKLYIAFSIILLQSCTSIPQLFTTQMEYLGNRHAPTDSVDVYVDEGAITRPYIIMGKGHKIENNWARQDWDGLQAAAINIAKKNGADAVFFKETYYSIPGTYINSNTQTQTDTIINKTTVRSNTSISPVAELKRFEILFLKYK